MESKYFEIHELVPKHIFDKYGEKAWRFVDASLINTIDSLKTHFKNGTITINNYYWGGDRHWSGLRTPASPYYSETSMHSFGKAVDIIFSEYDVDEVRKYIINKPYFFPFVKGIELDVTWLHIDVRNVDNLVKFKV